MSKDNIDEISNNSSAEACERLAAGRGADAVSKAGLQAGQSRQQALALCVRALEVCSGGGFSHIRQRDFARAYLDDFCCLCHGPMSNFLHDMPCPHWLLRRSRQQEDLVAIFEVYALADVLHYLLLTMQMNEKSHRAPMLRTLRGVGEHGLILRIDNKQFSFSMAQSEVSAQIVSVTVEYIRSKRTITLSVTGRASDCEMLSALVAVLAGEERLRNCDP